VGPLIDDTRHYLGYARNLKNGGWLRVIQQYPGRPDAPVAAAACY